MVGVPPSAAYVFPPTPPPCGVARDGGLALPAAARSVAILSPGRPVGQWVPVAAGPVVSLCWLTTPEARARLCLDWVRREGGQANEAGEEGLGHEPPFLFLTHATSTAQTRS